MSWDDDKPCDLDDAIKGAHPLKTGNHKRYARAMDLVGAKHPKVALVELVNCLLKEADDADIRRAKLADALDSAATLLDDASAQLSAALDSK